MSHSAANATEHRVHGLANDAIAAHWPPLTAHEVSAVLTNFAGHDSVRHLLWHSPRPFSAAALVDTDGGGLFVKRHHHSVRSAHTLMEEHRFAMYLRSAGVAVPAILCDTQGLSAITRGAWVYEVHAPADGVDRYRDAMSWQPAHDLHDARAAGTALADLHRAAQGFQAPQRSTHRLVARCDLIRAADPLAALAAQLAQRPRLNTYLRQHDWRGDLQRIAARHAELRERLIAQPSLWTHNDWHLSNLFWRDNTVSAVLDFGLASPTCAAFDIATAIERNAVAWLRLDHSNDIAHADVARALIQGYREHTALDAQAVHLVADLLPLVHIDFALSEIEYFHAITGRDDHADIAYHSFLCGHALWFDSAHGRAFLEALHGMA